MSDSVVRDTISYRIVRQILDHVYSDQEMEDSDFVSIFRTFSDVGGSWEAVVLGDPEAIDLLMSVLKAFVKTKKTLE